VCPRPLVAVVAVTVLLGCTAGPPSSGRTPEGSPAAAAPAASPAPSGGYIVLCAGLCRARALLTVGHVRTGSPEIELAEALRRAGGNLAPTSGI